MVLFILIIVIAFLLFSRPGRDTIEYIEPYFLRFQTIPENYKQHLVKYFKYYHYLDDDQQSEFERRVHYFIKKKEFIGRGKFGEVDDNIKALVAATAAQITFGFERMHFRHFKKILIYPDSYYSTIRKQYHNGEVHASGIIVLSARHFLRGIIKHDDGRNLGLHELAHALYIENKIDNLEYNFLDKGLLAKFAESGKEEMRRIKKGENPIYREYAVTNLFEFFAISIELFFEKPEELMDYNPKIYFILSELLNQDVLLMKRQAS